MIPAKELRIGNWVEVNGKPIQVKDIDDNGINLVFPSSFYENVSPSKMDCSYDGFFDDRAKLSIQPIPLTPGNLDKCGFFDLTITGHICAETRPGEALVYDPVQSVTTIEKSDGEIVFVPYLQPTSIHQLQNLYFAITGKELEYDRNLPYHKAT